MSTTISPGVLAIRPYITNAENMGLEKYKMVIHPGTKQVEPLACIETNGIPRYLTGLDDNAPEIRNIKDPKEKAARIKEIRTTVAELERELNATEIDPNDKDFWNKVVVLKPNNHAFWSKVMVECDNEPLYLDPKNNPMHRIIVHGIQAGGFNLVAKSLEDAESASKPPKFYLDKATDTAHTKIAGKLIKNNAVTLLQDLYSKGNRTKLMFIAKIIDLDGVQYKYGTSIDILYNNMDDFINGKGVERNASLAAQRFIDTATDYGMDQLKMKALVKDAAFYRIIQTKGDGMIYHTDTNTMLGRNLAEVAEYMLNPVNENFMQDFMEQVEKNWKEG